MSKTKQSTCVGATKQTIWNTGKNTLTHVCVILNSNITYTLKDLDKLAGNFTNYISLL